MWASKANLILAVVWLFILLVPLTVIWLQARSLQSKDPDKAMELRRGLYIYPAAILLLVGFTFTKSWVAGHGMTIMQLLSGLPVNAADAAIYEWYSTAASDFEASGGRVRGFRVSCAKRIALSDADLANGHRSKWCLMVTFIYRSQGDSTWRQAPPEPVVVALTNGVWARADDQKEYSGLRDCGCR